MSDERIKLAEERVAWLEHHVAQQDKAMLEMARRLDRVTAELKLLRERAASGTGAAGGGEGADAAAERPPHY